MNILSKRFGFLLVFAGFFILLGHLAYGAADSPFFAGSINPFAIPAGFPMATSARLMPEGAGTATLAFSISNHFSQDVENGVSAAFDGETRRLDTAVRFGLSGRMELAIDIPMIRHSGGFLDSFIDRWHQLVGVSDTGREDTPRNRLKYSLMENGTTHFGLDGPSSGIGDVRLSLGYQLPLNSSGRLAAARFGVKLPTGDPDRLTGSGGHALFVQLDVSDAATVPIKGITLIGSAGVLFTENEFLLEKFGRRAAAWGYLGLVWQLTENLTPKIQLNWHSPLYHGTGLTQMDEWAAAVVLGGDWKICGDVYLQFGLSEDIAVGTTPDVTFHLALTQKF